MAGVQARNYELERYLWGVTPCLMAWPAIVMHPGPGAFAVATTLCVAHAVDGVFHRRGLMPPWCSAPPSHARLPARLPAPLAPPHKPTCGRTKRLNGRLHAEQRHTFNKRFV